MYTYLFSPKTTPNPAWSTLTLEGLYQLGGSKHCLEVKYLRSKCGTIQVTGKSNVVDDSTNTAPTQTAQDYTHS